MISAKMIDVDNNLTLLTTDLMAYELMKFGSKERVIRGVFSLTKGSAKIKNGGKNV